MTGRAKPICFCTITAVLAGFLGVVAQAEAGGGDGQKCRVVEVQTTPTHNLQIVMWLEDAAGNYVDTAFITQLTGTYGLGNRPGMHEFNTAYRWPYGRRLATFPVWAHRHGMTWPLLIFQNHVEAEHPLNYVPDDGAAGPDENLSHPLGQSSRDDFYCRPLLPDEPNWDAQSCASAVGVFTDKGRPHATELSQYPPRADMIYNPQTDDSTVADFSAMNPFDAVSRATPEGGRLFDIGWAIPRDLPDGDYVVWLEVSKEFDQNQYYSYPEPAGIPWGEYGVPGRGQPSVVYRVPVIIASDETHTGQISEYAGYGDPDGIDGNIREPDPTITTNVSGSGASRLMLISEAGGMHRVKVTARAEDDDIPPSAAERFSVIDVGPDALTLSFVNTGDDGVEGQVKGYQLRYMAGELITEANFDQATPVGATIDIGESGTITNVTIDGLLPRTNYSFGIRPHDECLNEGPLTVVQATTPLPESGEVDACFIATAAYGSLMADQVAPLRRFRDLALRSNIAGELLVEAYYTFGPALAGVIKPSDTLRQTARALLAPVVSWARTILPQHD